MAIQQLTQPIVNPIAAFDATMPQAITFLVIGGAQVVGNRIVISDNQTGNVVYNNIVNTMKLAHTIPANTLSNGGYYNAVIYTIDNSANESAPSTPVPFYCYSQPTLTIANIPATETIGNGTYKFQGNYLQTESEQLNSYQFILYDSNKDILDKSDIIYYQSNSSLAYTFVGMDNDTSYYVELKGQTVNSTEITSGLMYFTVRYTQPASFAIVDLINDCENGYIQISSNIVAIDGKSNPEPPIYINDKEVDLRNIDAGITQDMQNGWQYIHKDRFNVTYNSSTGINNLSVNTVANWEIVYLPITVEPNVTYKFNFKCDVLEDYVPFSTYEGVRVQVLNNIIDSINLNNEIAYGYISNLISNKEYEIKFIPTTKTVYIAFNFGFAADGQTVKMNISNLKLYSNNAWVKWNEGFNISDDFTMRVWGRDFNDYEKIISLTNKENTPDNPNKIEMKWMIADVVETLPSYTSVSGKNVAIKNGFETDIKDLEVMGNSEQISKEPVDLGTGNYIKAETTRDMYLDIDVYGNQYQKQTIQNDNLLILEDTTITTNGITLTIKDGVITINGTSTASTNIDFKIKKKLKAGTYWHLVQRSGDAPSGNVGFLVMKSGGVIATINGRGGASFTLNEDTEVFYRIWTDKNNIISNVAYKCLISEGADSKPWVQGIPDSPSVDYPSEIETVKDNVKINAINKNFINMQKKTTYWIGAKVTVENNKITFVGATDGSLGLSFSSYESKIKMSKGNKITYSSKYVSGSYTSGNTYYNLKLIYQDGTSTVIYMNRNISTYKNNISKTIILEKDVVAYQIEGSGYTISGLTNELVYEFQLEIGDSASEIVEQSSQTAIMPIQQEMLENDYIADVEHHEWGEYMLTGNETNISRSGSVNGITQFNIAKIVYKNPNTEEITARSNYFLGVKWDKSWTIDNCICNTTDGYSIKIMTSEYTTVEDFKTWLKSKYDEGSPVIIYYKLATPVNLELTSEQKAIQSTLKPAYADITNIYATEDLPILKVSTLRVPSPSVPSPIYSSGDQRNLLEDLGLFDVSYTQDYFKVTDTTFKLKPNFVYNLSFDYTINNASTDLYFTVCYKNGNNITDITGAVLYYNQATGRSSVSFMVPEDIPDNSTLSVKFARTLIPANVNVSISNVQLEKGRVVHNYQKHGLYNIYPTAVEKNIFDYDKIYYVENKNTEISYIQNGISANLAGTNETAYIAIGFPNILQPGQNYTISYNSYGELLSSKLYTMNKETGERIEEVTLNNGSFTAPSNVYDFLFEFTLNDMVENNQVQIWNIQIETGDQVTEYEVYKPNQTTITLDQPLRAIGNYKDIICLESPNLLNPQTQIANVKGGQDYYFSQSGNTQYQLKFLTEYGNLISSVDISSGKITVPDTGVQIKVNASSSDITSNKLQINEGTTAEIYYPYVNEPSVIRYIKEIILTGDESWAMSANKNNVSYYLSADYSSANNILKGVDKKTLSPTVDAQDKTIALITCSYFKIISPYSLFSLGEIGCCADLTGNETQLRLGFSLSSSLTDLTTFKAWLKSRYNDGNPIIVNYILATPTVEQLSSDNILALRNLKTYDGNSNVFTNNNMPANINFSYISGQSEQETKNAYITLKCWNGNVMPYFVHSNYIDIPKETDKVFIWVRKKNNIFDLKIENLGDYQGETI